MRQADDRRHGETVDGRVHALQRQERRDLFPDRVPRAVAVDGQGRRRAHPDHQERVLRIRFRARPRPHDGLRLLDAARHRPQEGSGAEGRRVRQVPAGARL